MRRHIPPPLAAALAVVVLLLAAPAPAQISADQVKQRYDKQTKGAGVEEWARKMNSDDPLERLEGVRSLADSTDPAAVPYLVQALGDSDMRVKAKAIDACGTARAADATPVLVQMLFLRGTSPEVQQRILAALGKIGDQRAAVSIVEFLGRDTDHATRGTAIFALGDIADPSTLEFLDKLAGEEAHPTLKRLAREAAAKVRYQQTVKNTEAKQPLDSFLRQDQPPP
ncbi:HEAT repeat domain-containing protein [bacterium]|nr:HEAT repeat domain-containing protein [bacterium]